MAATVVTAADSRRLVSLSTLDEVLGSGAVQGSLALFERLIDQASAAVERYCRRIFAQQRYAEIIPAVKDEWLWLTHAPVVSVTSVVHGAETATGYRVELPAAGGLFRQDGWALYATDPEWTVTYVAGYILPEQTNAMVPSGEVLPADIEAAVLEAIKVWHHERFPGDRVQSRDFGDQRVSYFIQAGRGALPVLAQELLKPWRRLVVR